MTSSDERLLAAVSVAADRRRLERVARKVLERDDAVTALCRRAAAADDDGAAAWREAREVLERRGGNPFNLLDLVVEVSQQDLERRGERRTWSWPGRHAAGSED